MAAGEEIADESAEVVQLEFSRLGPRRVARAAPLGL